MNFAIRTLLVAMVICGSCKTEEKTCPSHGRYLPTPQTISNKTVCGKMYFNSSCCNEDTAGRIQNSDPAIFNLNKVTCGGSNKRCDNAIRRHACLFECSPDLGRSFDNASLTLKDVRICKSSCEWLFDECKDESIVTCTKDWWMAFDGMNFSCDDKQNQCFALHSEDRFRNAKEFCNALREPLVSVYSDNDYNCFNLTSGEYVTEPPPTTSALAFKIFKYLGLAVVALVICFAMFYAVTYVMKKNRISRGL